MIQVTLDAYLLDCLLPDLVGHDRRLASFIIYLYLYRQASQQANWSVRMWHQSIAAGTGLAHVGQWQCVGGWRGLSPPPRSRWPCAYRANGRILKNLSSACRPATD